MIHLKLAEVERCAEEAIRYHGGSFGLMDKGKLESAVMAVQQSAFGEPLFQTLEEAAGAYWFYICQAHAFVDGNKRTALYAAIYFLGINGYRLDLPEHEVELITMKIASGEMSREAVAKRVRIAPFDQPTG